MNVTLEKFGYPGTALWQSQHWAVLLRPQQATLASLVVCTLSQAKSFSELSTEAAADYATVLRLVERALQKFTPYDKINFLTLMMVDPNVHTHVLPRYAIAHEFDGVTFLDPGWPAQPDLKHATELPEKLRADLMHTLSSCFRTAANAQHA
jgi:diadenosine tetraphosphate (Ap4A) HIT family hydrolase